MIRSLGCEFEARFFHSNCRVKFVRGAENNPMLLKFKALGPSAKKNTRLAQFHPFPSPPSFVYVPEERKKAAFELRYRVATTLSCNLMRNQDHLHFRCERCPWPLLVSVDEWRSLHLTRVICARSPYRLFFLHRQDSGTLRSQY